MTPGVAVYVLVEQKYGPIWRRASENTFFAWSLPVGFLTGL